MNEDEGVSTYTLSRTIFYLVNHFWSSSNEDVATIDQNGNELVKEIDERGNETLYTYRKNSGRLKKIAYANGDYMKARYNMLDQMISEKWYDENDTLKYEYVYSYDNEGNLVRTIDSKRVFNGVR